VKAKGCGFGMGVCATDLRNTQALGVSRARGRCRNA
jgi:hypothetical protein